MSDLTAVNSILRHHVLEFVVFEWDGMRHTAMVVTEQLKRELAGLGAELTRANHHIEGGANTLTFEITRKADGVRFESTAHNGEWMVIDLHNQAFYSLRVIGADIAEEMFQRSRPVVVLRPQMGARPQITP